jgi:hypothetical protein
MAEPNLDKLTLSRDDKKELITQLTGLKIHFRLALRDILSNKNLKFVFNEYLSTLRPIVDKEKINMIKSVYEKITSKNMLQLILDYIYILPEDSIEAADSYPECKSKYTNETIIKDCILSKTYGKTLYDNIIQKISEDKDNISVIIYLEIYNFMKSIISHDTQPNNTSIVSMSTKNSEISDFLKELPIYNYEQLINNFNNFKYIEKGNTSNSNAIIFYATLNLDSSKKINSVRALDILNTPRLYFKIYKSGVESLDTEKAIYEQLFKLVKYNVTPNILCTVGITNHYLSNFYDNFVKTVFKQDIKHTIKQDMKQINTNLSLDEDDKWEETSIIVTQKGDDTLQSTFRNGKASVEHVNSVLFQLIYTMYVFEKINFSHGDLRTGNIFINKLPEPITLHYKVNGKHYEITTDWIVKIYDFDHSTIYKTSNISVNKRKEEIYEVKNESNIIGILNTFNKNLDKVKLLLELSENPLFTEFVKTVFPRLYSNSIETIKNTYEKLLFKTKTDSIDSEIQKKDNNLREANRIFGTQISHKSELSEFGISKEILDMKWIDYFNMIGRTRTAKFEGNPPVNYYGFIIKDKDTVSDKSTIRDNHLWVPDEIIMEYDKMFTLFSDYNLEEKRIKAEREAEREAEIQAKIKEARKAEAIDRIKRSIIMEAKEKVADKMKTDKIRRENLTKKIIMRFQRTPEVEKDIEFFDITEKMTAVQIKEYLEKEKAKLIEQEIADKLKKFDEEETFRKNLLVPLSTQTKKIRLNPVHPIYTIDDRLI